MQILFSRCYENLQTHCFFSPEMQTNQKEKTREMKGNDDKVSQLGRLPSGNNKIHTGEFYNTQFPFGQIFVLLGATSLWCLEGCFPPLLGEVQGRPNGNIRKPWKIHEI